ncbi:MAG: flagellar motor switch protein FliM [Epsilonproteobacteria bacterium]|nr:MAG: flagellar motor switch protein FliM [Campylobacterota bacterium]
MAEFLSQDEIDALLDIADEDGGLEDINEDGGSSKKDKSYAIYDFKKPNRISAEQMKAFNALHDKMLRTTISELSAMLRKIVDVKLYSIEQMTYGEFILSIPQITSLNTLSIKPLDGRIVMECNPAISHKIIAHLLGNGESSLTDSTEKELTEIELQVFNHFYQLIIRNLKLTWDSVSTINLKTESMDTNANAIQIISDHEIVLLVVFEITIDDESGFLSICYPISYIEQLLDVIVEKVFAEAKNKKVSKQKDINALISGSKMKIDVMLAETEMCVNDLLNLQEGDIISFSKNATSASTKVYINNKEKWSASAGSSNNRKAIQIQSNVDHEKMETLHSLKALNKEREDNTKQANDAIAKLISAREEF